jgi:hypothetical protein
MNIPFIRKNITVFAIIIFLILYCILIFSKTSLIFNTDGSLRQFGVGYNTRSVLPIWLLSIVIAILSYFSVLYYISYSKIQF